MLSGLATIIIAATLFIILFYAYVKNNKLAVLSTIVILAAYALTMLIGGFTSMIGGVDFLSFLVDIFNGIASIVIFVEAALLIYFTFFSSTKAKHDILKWTIVVYVVFILLVEFNVFK